MIIFYELFNPFEKPLFFLRNLHLGKDLQKVIDKQITLFNYNGMTYAIESTRIVKYLQVSYISSHPLWNCCQICLRALDNFP